MVNGADTHETWRTVDAVQTSCDLIAALRELEGAGITELATHLGLAKGTVHSHLATLRQNEYVVKSGDTYQLSLRWLDFGRYTMDRLDHLDIVQAELDTLAAETGEVTQFMIEEHGRGVYLYKSQGECGVETASYVGSRMPLNCTAIGKAILAHLPKETVQWIIAHHGLPQQTEQTITERTELFAELETIRTAGFATDDEEILTGLRCVAVPIRRPTGDLFGAVSVAGPIQRMHGKRYQEDLPELLLSTANVIEINIAQRDRHNSNETHAPFTSRDRSTSST